MGSDALEELSVLSSHSTGVVVLWKHIVVLRTEQGDQTLVSKSIPDSSISWSAVDRGKRKKYAP